MEGKGAVLLEKARGSVTDYSRDESSQGKRTLEKKEKSFGGSQF